MKKLLLLLVFLPALALADTINFAWDAVTTDIGGNAITVTGYKLYLSNTSGSYTTTPAATTSATTQSLSITTLGKYYAVATAYDAAGESAYSNEVTFTVAAGKPSPVRNLKITSP